jgi:prolipoprotein diacylglyceryltransferase
MPNWYLIIQLLLCLSGIYLTIKRFIRKKKGQEYRESAGISLAASIVFFIGVRAYYLL